MNHMNKEKQPSQPTPTFLEVEEVAELLRLKPRTIYNMVSQRRIPFRKAGRQLLFELKEIDEWTKGNAGK
jgi:excisionase family DNA binding protein